MKYFKLFENIKNEEIFNKIRNDYFKSSIIDFSYKQRDGYRVTKDKIIFGTVMTYNPDIEYLLHEMGHFVLFKDYNRLLKSEYGLNYPKIEVEGQLYDLPSNWTDVKNEVRAVIFQYILAKKYGILLDLNSWLSSLRLLQGFLYVPVNGAEQIENEWFEHDGEKVPYNIQEKRKLETIKIFFDEEIKKEKYNIKYFDSEWFNRIKFLEDKLLKDENIYGYWDLANATDITEFLKFLKDNNIIYKYDSYSNKLEIEIATEDIITQKLLISELDKVDSYKEKDNSNIDTDNDIILITPIKYY